MDLNINCFTHKSIELCAAGERGAIRPSSITGEVAETRSGTTGAESRMPR